MVVVRRARRLVANRPRLGQRSQREYDTANRFGTNALGDQLGTALQQCRGSLPLEQSGSERTEIRPDHHWVQPKSTRQPRGQRIVEPCVIFAMKLAGLTTGRRNALMQSPCANRPGFHNNEDPIQDGPTPLGTFESLRRDPAILPDAARRSFR